MPDHSAPDDTTQPDPPAFRSDPHLLAGIAARHPAALQELYDRYFPSAYALAVRMLRDSLAAEACVQTVFLDLWQHPPGADPTDREWNTRLLAAVHLQARQQQRSPLGQPPPALVPPTSTEAVHSATGPGRFAARRRLAEQQQAAQAALALLPPIQRTVLQLAYFDGRTAPEIAASLQESRAAIDRHLRDGMWQLRTALTPAARPVAERAASPAPAAQPDRAPPALEPLAVALARVQAAQQHAVEARRRAHTQQQQAQEAQQRAATLQQRSDAALRQLQVLQELYAYLATHLQPGAEDFTQTEAYFASHPHNIDVSQVAAVLAVLNARCDYDVYRLLPTLIS